MACNCTDQCPHSDQCIAVGFPDTGECWVACSKDRDAATDDIPSLELDTQIDVDTRDVDLLDFAEFLSQRSAVELLIPVSAARGKVGVKLTNTSFAAVLEQAGIVAGDPIESGT